MSIGGTNAKYWEHLTAPGKDATEITPNDSTDLDPVPHFLYIGTGGSLRVTTAAGNVRNFQVEAGVILPVIVHRVHATGTTATDIVGIHD